MYYNLSMFLSQKTCFLIVEAVFQSSKNINKPGYFIGYDNMTIYY